MSCDQNSQHSLKPFTKKRYCNSHERPKIKLFNLIKSLFQQLFLLLHSIIFSVIDLKSQSPVVSENHSSWAFHPKKRHCHPHVRPKSRSRLFNSKELIKSRSLVFFVNSIIRPFTREGIISSRKNPKRNISTAEGFVHKSSMVKQL